MIRLILPAATLALAGCAPQPAPELPPAPGMCNAAPAQGLVGRDAAASMDEAKALAGAQTVRVYKQDAVITLDYRGDRVNLVVDDANRILEVKCG